MVPRRRFSFESEEKVLLHDPPPFQTWRNSVSAIHAPQVETSTEKEVPHSDEKEVVIAAGKEVMVEEGKEAALAYYPQVVSDEDLPQAMDPEGHEEVAPKPDQGGRDQVTQSGWLKGQRRVRWIIAAVAVVLVLVAAALGAGLGIALHHASSTNSSQFVKSGLTAYDASIIPSPTSTAAIPTGTFMLSNTNTIEARSGCLPANQTVAWDCSISSGSSVNIVVEDEDDVLSARIFATPQEQHSYYGTFPQNTTISLGKTYMALDKNATSKGPATYFQQYYDKIVIVPANASSNTSLPENNPFGTSRIEAGARAWYCVFKTTLLEGFVYSNDTEMFPAMGTQGTTATSTTTASMITGTPVSNSTTASSASTPSSPKPYPRIVKLDERLVSGNSYDQPYCQLFQVKDDYSTEWVRDPSAQAISMQLDLQNDGQSCGCEWLGGKS